MEETGAYIFILIFVIILHTELIITTFWLLLMYLLLLSQSQFSATESNEMKQEEKFLQAVDLITESAEQGHTEALTTLGQLYELADNYKVARQWYDKFCSWQCAHMYYLLVLCVFCFVDAFIAVVVRHELCCYCYIY